jgi:hypothetical protein
MEEIEQEYCPIYYCKGYTERAQESALGSLDMQRKDSRE